MENRLNYIPKFKAWDVFEQKMRLVQSINYAKDGYAETILVHLVGGISSGYVHGESCILIRYSGLKDKKGTEVYEDDIVKYGLRGIGIVKYVADDYSLGFVVEVIAGSDFYGYDGDQEEWTSVEVLGNLHSHPDLVEKYKYGCTSSFEPITQEEAKNKFVSYVKSYYLEWVPTQVLGTFGVWKKEVIDELRKELVKEGRLIQDPTRYWMCKFNSDWEGSGKN